MKAEWSIPGVADYPRGLSRCLASKNVPVIVNEILKPETFLFQVHSERYG